MSDNDQTLEPWVHQQIQAFKGWLNFHLDGVDPKLHVNNLRSDLCDGIRLAKLLGHLDKGKAVASLKVNLAPKFKFHQVENVANVLSFLDDNGCKTIGISAHSIVDASSLKSLLGLIWLLILKYQIAAPSRRSSVTAGKESPLSMLEAWVAASLAPEITYTGFHDTFADGKAFCLLVSKTKECAIDLEKTAQMTPVERMRTAFAVAANEFNIPAFLDANVVAAKETDEHSAMTYLTLLRNYQQQPPAAKEDSKIQSSGAEVSVLKETKSAEVVEPAAAASEEPLNKLKQQLEDALALLHQRDAEIGKQKDRIALLESELSSKSSECNEIQGKLSSLSLRYDQLESQNEQIEKNKALGKSELPRPARCCAWFFCQK